MTLQCRNRSFFFICSNVAKPSTMGIITSRMITSGIVSLECLVLLVRPCYENFEIIFLNVYSSDITILGSSSTIKIFFIAIVFQVVL
jgi:hypothetical protein